MSFNSSFNNAWLTRFLIRFFNNAWFVSTARRRNENREKRWSDRRRREWENLYRTFVLVFPAPLLEKKEWGRRGKSFSPGILVSLGEEEERRGVEKWRGSSARGWSGSAKIIGFLEGCRHHAVYLSVEMAATSFLFFFFFFFLDTAKRAISVGAVLQSGLNFYIFRSLDRNFLISNVLLSSFFFLTRSRAVSIRSRKKNEKNISWDVYRYDALLADSCNSFFWV